MFTTLFHRLKEMFMEEDKKKLSPAERYRLHRVEMEKYFTDENEQNRKEVPSPSGKYRLVVTTYGTKKGCWDYSRGRVYAGEKLVADVKRNYHSFEWAWAEGHPNGHDYLLCGEDYQGQTVVELDTGNKVSSTPDEHMDKGWGFCWVRIYPSPDKRVLAVDGCYWACPYEVVLFDFTNPMKLPLPELGRWDEVESFDTWETEGKMLLSRTVEVRKSDGKILYDLPDEEMDKAEADGDVEEKKITKVWEPTCLNARVRYEEGLRKLAAMTDAESESKSAEKLREELDGLGKHLTPTELGELRKLSASLP